MERIADPLDHYGMCVCEAEGCDCHAELGPFEKPSRAVCQNCSNDWHNDGQRDCAACEEPCHVDDEDANMVLDQDHTYHIECFESLSRENKRGLILLGLIEPGEHWSDLG